MATATNLGLLDNAKNAINLATNLGLLDNAKNAINLATARGPDPIEWYEKEVLSASRRVKKIPKIIKLYSSGGFIDVPNPGRSWSKMNALEWTLFALVKDIHCKFPEDTKMRWKHQDVWDLLDDDLKGKKDHYRNWMASVKQIFQSKTGGKKKESDTNYKKLLDAAADAAKYDTKKDIKIQEKKKELKKKNSELEEKI